MFSQDYHRNRQVFELRHGPYQIKHAAGRYNYRFMERVLLYIYRFMTYPHGSPLTALISGRHALRIHIHMLASKSPTLGVAMAGAFMTLFTANVVYPTRSKPKNFVLEDVGAVLKKPRSQPLGCFLRQFHSFCFRQLFSVFRSGIVVHIICRPRFGTYLV